MKKFPRALTLKVTNETYEQIAELADKEKRSVNQIIRLLINIGLARFEQDYGYFKII